MNLATDNCLNTYIVTFDELSARKEPMGFIFGKAVFENDRAMRRVELGHSYFCQLSERNGTNCYFAHILEEVDTNDLFEEHREQIVNIICSKYPDLVRNAILDVKADEIRHDLERKYDEMISAYKEEIASLKENLVGPEATNHAEDGTGRVSGNIIRADYLPDGYYSLRCNRTGTKVLISSDEGGDLSCVGGKIDLSKYSGLIGNKQMLLKKCSYITGVLLEV